MQAIINHLQKFDWLLIGAIFLLVGLGLMSLFSLSAASGYFFFTRQLVWFAIGVCVLVAASVVDFRLFRTQTVVVLFSYIFSITLLGVVLLLQLKVRGIEAWLKIGWFVIQPVEPAKLSLIVLLAKYFSKRHIEIYRIHHLIVSGIYLAIPACLVLAQPDLGSALVLIAIWIAMIVFSGMKLRHVALLALILIVLSGVAWNFGLAPYQKARITSFLNPYEDPKGAGYQMIQSMIAVGSGKIWGKGLGYGSQSHLNFLPEAETDFIFAAYAEEWGFVGITIMLALFSLVFWRIIRIGQKSADNFSRLYAIGFAALVFVQSFIHIGMNMGVLPITGITLPFVSYGGSSLVTLLAGVGILQNIKINSRPVTAAKGRHDFG